MSDVDDIDWLSTNTPAPTASSVIARGSPNIRACATAYAGAWEDIPFEDKPDTEDPTEKALQERRRKLKQSIGAVLASQHVVTLFGLGPSAGVKGPRMSDLWRLVRDNDVATFKSIQKKVGDVTADDASGDIEDFLSRCHMIANAPVQPDASASAFIATAEKVIAKACREFTKSADLADHAHCLRILARRPAEKSRARVFTTNYDLCIELAAAQSGVLIVDGFGRESPPTFDGSNFDIDFVRRRAESKSPEYLDGVIHLLKLHGSVDWTESKGQIVRREEPDAPIIIYPKSDKFELSYRQPFLEMMSQLQTMLRQSNLGILILGFGFADAHLSEMLLAAVRKNLSLRVVIATLDCEKHCTEAEVAFFRQKMALLKKLIEQGDSRITLIDCDFPALVRLIPNLGTETEEDKLRSVLRTLVK
jgi:SIR2-like domain